MNMHNNLLLPLFILVSIALWIVIVANSEGIGTTFAEGLLPSILMLVVFTGHSTNNSNVNVLGLLLAQSMLALMIYALPFVFILERGSAKIVSIVFFAFSLAFYFVWQKYFPANKKN